MPECGDLCCGIRPGRVCPASKHRYCSLIDETVLEVRYDSCQYYNIRCYNVVLRQPKHRKAAEPLFLRNRP